MAIPQMTDDLAVIQKLSDLPNSEDGLTADELKAKFDEAALAIQAYLNEKLAPAIQAENIPFQSSTAVPAGDIQNAIEAVQRQIVDAVAGSILPNSITKEKLAVELLERVYGGRAWVSATTPNGLDNPDTDFPIGQVWLRPSFTVDNLATSSWTGEGCEVTTEDGNVTLTGNMQSAEVRATQTLYNAGQEGDIVHILFQVQDVDSEINRLAVRINGGDAQEIVVGRTYLKTTVAAGGSVTISLIATFGAASVADGSVTFDRYTVVNGDATMRQLDDAEKIADWNDYLWNTLPEGFDNYYSAEAVFIQGKAGEWQQISFETLPISRGGTGLTRFPASQYVKTDKDGALEFLSSTQVVDDLGALKLASGTYNGTGEARTLTLSVKPKLLYVFSTSGPTITGNSIYGTSVCDHPATLADGATCMELWKSTSSETPNSPSYTISLSGDTVSFSGKFGNQSSITYKWVAIY